MRMNPLAVQGGTGWALAMAACVLVGVDASAAQRESSPVDAQTEALFALEVIPKLQIEIPPAGIERLRGGGWTWGWRGGARERPEVQATIREGDRVYTNVALHLKGAAGSFQPIDRKPSFTLNFDKHVKGQTFHGLEKISLNNSAQDPSYSTERLCRELFNAAGVPAPRAGYATVQLNGRPLGLYVLLEGYNRQFLRRHFKNPKGNLYDGGFLKDVDSRLATNSGDASDQSGLVALAEAAEDPDRAARFAGLEDVLDMDRFVTFLAMEILVCHWDGYGMNKNNYRVYFEPENKRMVFMPHGMDQMFGVMMVQASMGVRPPFRGLVARALLETSEGRRRYFRRLAELNESLFDVEAITNRVFQTAAKVQPVLAELDPSAATGHLREVDDLCTRIAQRKVSLDDQLSGAQGTVLEFNDDGMASLGRWNSVTNYGTPEVAESVSDGRPVLYINAARGVSVGSWRTKVLLEEGRYRFEGRMHIRNVAGDPRDGRAGAGLRIYGKPATRKAVGSADWREVACIFEVPEGMRDVELICELRAHQGEVWFDRNSLRLIRE